MNRPHGTYVIAYENRGFIVIVVKRVLSKPSVKVPEHGQCTRASQNRPIQTILQDISGPTEEHIVTSFLAECVRHPESFYGNLDRRFISGVVQLHTRPSQGRSFIQYGAIGQLPSITSTHGLTHSLGTSVLALSGGRKAPTCRIAGRMSHRTRSLYCK